ncbi:MAG: 1,4-dihydroxy-2-naphthoate polyprenyltransferase [Enterococcaceae bacterium]|jgi:1,4-dihydroxy-2-naphthoate octaprenyltransferase|nr:1,4-dihydroxy-2-naphthoate polyprenyltransferase [Enterococcaceae bacterium]MCI1920276.1 1,4-dihydroxy-2-naphthoate polyprenyltransferase [Enterococcaceae bacterium]
MKVKDFLKFVEIQTKLASLCPFLLGIAFSISYFKMVHWGYMILFFIAMFLFDMATTAINNSMDYLKARDEKYRQQENILGQAHISLRLARNLIFAMVIPALMIGLYLSIQTGWLLLLIGAVCCFIGVFYTFGPVPLSRMPLGEVFSGFTMGLGIFAMVIYLNTFQAKIFYLSLAWPNFSLSGVLPAVFAIILASLPIVASIANIMLANNMRDLETDINNHRFTLVFYIGRDWGRRLFSVLALLPYLLFLAGWIFQVYSWPILLTWLTLPLMKKNLLEYRALLPQPQSFGIAIKNLLLINGSYLIALCLEILLQVLRK